MALVSTCPGLLGDGWSCRLGKPEILSHPRCQATDDRRCSPRAWCSQRPVAGQPQNSCEQNAAKRSHTPCVSAQPEAAASISPAARTAQRSIAAASRRRDSFCHAQGASSSPGDDATAKAAIAAAPDAGPPVIDATSNAPCSSPQGQPTHSPPASTRRPAHRLPAGGRGHRRGTSQRRHPGRLSAGPQQPQSQRQHEGMDHGPQRPQRRAQLRQQGQRSHGRSHHGAGHRIAGHARQVKRRRGRPAPLAADGRGARGAAHGRAMRRAGQAEQCGAGDQRRVHAR